MRRVNMKNDSDNAPTVKRAFPEHDIWIGLVFYDDGAFIDCDEKVRKVCDLAENRTQNQKYISTFKFTLGGVRYTKGPEISADDQSSAIELMPNEINTLHFNLRFEMKDNLNGQERQVNYSVRHRVEEIIGQEQPQDGPIRR